MSRAISKKNFATKAPFPNPARSLRYVVLDTDTHWLDELGRDKTLVCGATKEAVLKAIEQTDANSLWISCRSKATEELAKTLVQLISGTKKRRTTFGDLLTLEAAKTQVRPTLEGFFRHVIGVSREFKRLRIEELTAVLSSSPEERRDAFIGGILSLDLGTLVLVRGNLERIVVPLSIFKASGTTAPDFSKFDLEDYGRTLKFGDYEATADIVLWEVDPDYRRRAKAKQRASARGFGASLRRLRRQRGLSQSGFPNVTRKTIARIEKGEVEKPHKTTRNRIAEALGVVPDEIETY